MISAICLAAAVIAVASLSRDREPKHEGRRLSQWLALYCQYALAQDTTNADSAASAIRSIGTNAFPPMLEWLRYEPPPWHRAAVRHLPEFLLNTRLCQFLVDGPGSDKAINATLAFAILGSNAVAIIPELEHLARDTNHPIASEQAVIALTSMGTPALPHIAAILSDTNCPRRDRIPVSLVIMAHQVGTNACLPMLNGALTDPDPKVRFASARMLKYLAPKAATNATPE
jgi:hypothetical protein